MDTQLITDIQQACDSAMERGATAESIAEVLGYLSGLLTRLAEVKKTGTTQLVN